MTAFNSSPRELITSLLHDLPGRHHRIGYSQIKTTFGLQDVLFGVGSGAIGGFEDSDVGGFAAHGNRFGRGAKVAPVVVRNDFIDIGLAGDCDVMASLENVHTVEFANDAELVKRDDKVVPDILDCTET